MAKQIIGLGTTANDGTGDNLRIAGDKINDNFSELYMIGGWGHYVDDIATNLTVTSTPSKLTINGLGATNNVAYLPYDIRGIGNLWNTSTNKIEPIHLGDAYDLRIDLGILTKTSTPTILNLVLDIGVGAGITIPIVERTISLSKTPPYTLSIGFPIFCLTNFITNGGQIFLSTDVGSVTIGKRNIMIKRDFDGQL